MSSIGRPRVRRKPPDEPLLHGGVEPVAIIQPRQAIPNFETIQAISNLTGDIERLIEGDDGKRSILLRAIDLSRWILAEAESLRTLPAISLEGYKSLLQIILKHLVWQEVRTIDPADEEWLNEQLNTYSKAFMSPTAQFHVQPGFFSNARNFVINGGSFKISQRPDTRVQGMCEEILRYVSDSNSRALHDGIVRLQEALARQQETSEMTLWVVCFNTIVLFG